MQGKGCMDIGDGKLALGEGVAADFVSGDAVQIGVGHRFFQGFSSPAQHGRVAHLKTRRYTVRCVAMRHGGLCSH